MTLSIERLRCVRNFLRDSGYHEGEKALDELIAIREQHGKPVYQAAIEQNLWSDVIKTTFDTMTEAGVITRVIFTAPQSPVALPEKYVRNELGQNMLNGKPEPRVGFGAGWNAAIEAAGGIVSTSDERLMQDMSGIVKDGE